MFSVFRERLSGVPDSAAWRLRSFLLSWVIGLSNRWQAWWQRNEAREHHHFGGLSDQTLADLGLQRETVRAVEYGIIPPRQALLIQVSRCDLRRK